MKLAEAAVGNIYNVIVLSNFFSDFQKGVERTLAIFQKLQKFFLSVMTFTCLDEFYNLLYDVKLLNWAQLSTNNNGDEDVCAFTNGGEPHLSPPICPLHTPWRKIFRALCYKKLKQTN